MKKNEGVFFLILMGVAFAITAEAISINLSPQAQNAIYQAANNPCTTVINFYMFALLISGILAFGAIVWGGIKYATSAGNPSGQSEGIDWIKGALLGILLLAASYLILNIINPALVHCSMPGLEQLPTTTPPGGGGGAG